jgi:hypothetical protein
MNGIEVIIITIASIITALTVIFASFTKSRRAVATWLSRTGVNEIRQQDIDMKSYIGQTINLSKEMVATHSDIKDALNRQHQDLLRIQIVQFISYRPTEVVVLEDIYTLYKRAGGNGFIDGMMNDWRAKYNKSACDYSKTSSAKGEKK